jgi:hypothetical protein
VAEDCNRALDGEARIPAMLRRPISPSAIEWAVGDGTKPNIVFRCEVL